MHCKIHHSDDHANYIVIGIYPRLIRIHISKVMAQFVFVYTESKRKSCFSIVVIIFHYFIVLSEKKNESFRIFLMKFCKSILLEYVWIISQSILWS